MSLSVIPLTILGQITGVSGSGDTVLYQVSFKSIDGTPLYGVAAVWTDEQAEIEALAAEKPYGVWINPINGTFTVKFAGYTYVGSADLTDSDVLAGVTPIEFMTTEVSNKLLPEVTAEDDGKTLQVENGEWAVKDADYTRTTVFFSGNATVVDTHGSPEIEFGQIEGLDFSVKTVELTMEKDGQTKVVTLVYDSIDPIWSGADDDNTYELTESGGDFALRSSLFNESVVGEVYSITLSTESVEPNFKTAVAKTVEGLNRTIDVSLTQADFLQLVTNGYATIDITLTAREWGLNEDTAISYYIGLVLPDESKISLEPVGTWGQSSVGVPNYRAWVFDFGYSTSPKNLNLIYAHIIFGNLVVLYVETGHVAVTAGLVTN